MRRQHYAHTPLPVELISDSGRMVTEYQARFFANNALAVRETGKPPVTEEYLEGKVAGVTTFRSDYVPHDVTQRPPKVTKEYVPPEGSMMHTTTYVHDYKAYSIQQNIVTKTLEYSPPSAKMDIRSTYKEEFRSWDAQLQRPLRPSCNPKPRHSKLDTTDPPQRHHSPKPLPFESVTNYKLQYVSHPAQPKQPIQRAVYKPSGSPLSGVTTHRHDYRCLQVEVARPNTSKATWESNPTPLQGYTEFRDRYKTWPLRHRTVEHPPPEDRAECSVYQADYQQCQPMPSIHTPTQPWAKDKVSLEALCPMRGNCRAREVKERIPVTRDKETDRPAGAAGSTTTGSPQHRLKATVPPPSFQPVQRAATLSREQNDVASSGSDVAREIQPVSVCRAARAHGNKLQRTLSARERCTGCPATASSNTPKCSHSPKRRAVQSAVLSRGKRAG
ncbi:hypothetical protein AAFF_G00191350 [Aldrovandia affinis]|uniref:Stabilizer of axonemal microtubules 2-like n=1 Tax=Aldrovandia affinis TaxID=143900 RepID=A0AAD7W6K8_9TELE|nr:hypothetical protein AAFF_G00191350 [Aldrovandia affinis]